MIERIISKILNYTHNLIKYIRQGGVVYINIAQVNHNETLKDKKIIVTGGSSGIGYAIAKKFLEEGGKVVITGRNKEKLYMATESMKSNSIFALQWDICDFSIADKKIAQAHELLGGIDIIVNNAGVYTTNGFMDINETVWDDVMNSNIKGLFFICQAISRYYLKNNTDKIHKIINITSIRGAQGDCSPYGISKWGANGFTKGLARDLINNNIIVNGIAPGVTATNINGIDVKENAISNEPKNKRIGTPEEIAELALFLASDAANNIVGQIIACDGGTLIQ